MKYDIRRPGPSALVKSLTTPMTFLRGQRLLLNTNPDKKFWTPFQMAVVTSDFPGSFTMVSKPAKGPAITTKWMVTKMMMWCDVMVVVMMMVIITIVCKPPRGQVSPSNGWWGKIWAKNFTACKFFFSLKVSGKKNKTYGIDAGDG